jgi:seryl-tRNA synthetase
MKCKKQFSTEEEYNEHINKCQAKKKDTKKFEDLNIKIEQLTNQVKELTKANEALKKELDKNAKSKAPNESETLRARCDVLGIKYIKKTTNKELKELISDFETDIMNKAGDLGLDSTLPIDELIELIKEAKKE